MSTNLFGTDGIRSQFGNEPFTPSGLTQLGQSIVQWAQKKYRHQPSILLAHDTRLSCDIVKSAFKTGALLYPINLVDAGTLPSPAVAALLQSSKQFDLGIIISASHNPYHDNGIKIIDAQGKISKDDEQSITDLYTAKTSSTDYTTLGRTTHTNMQDEYIEQLISFFPKNFLRGKKIVLDCAHGATYVCAPQIFKKLGAEVITLFDKPNGLNINKQCGSMHTEPLQKKVLECKADVGFAFDGDGDRVVAVNRFGQVKNGDDLLTLLLEHPRYQSMKTVVGTIMTNQGLEVYLNQSNKSLLRTPVGDRYVFEELKKQNLLLGGEASGHIILRDYLNTGDGIFTALRTIEAMHFSKNWDMTTFTKFPQVNTAIKISAKKDLNQPPFSEIIAASKNKLNKGRLIIRYSGTEPVLRIMVEDDDWEHAQTICTTLSNALQERLLD